MSRLFAVLFLAVVYCTPATPVITPENVRPSSWFISTPAPSQGK